MHKSGMSAVLARYPHILSGVIRLTSVFRLALSASSVRVVGNGAAEASNGSRVIVPSRIQCCAWLRKQLKGTAWLSVLGVGHDEFRVPSERP